MADFRERKAHERLLEGQAALAREDFIAAEEALEHSLRLDPRARNGWLLWAESLERQGKMLEASRVLEQGRRHHPEDPALELALAHARAETGQFLAAEQALVELHERWPEEREPLAHLCRVLRDTRQWQRLVELLERALAGRFSSDFELAALLERCRIWRDERHEELPPPTSMREHLQLDHGCVLLGTGHDDGLTIPWYSTYACSEFDVITTCARLLGFAQQFAWTWSALLAVDPAAEPLVEALARVLEIPVVGAEQGDRALEPDSTLAVASVLSPSWTTDTPAHVRACADAGNLFAFAVLHYEQHDSLPPLIGIAGGERICLPWWRLGEARIGFSRFGLIDELPPEIDPRPAAVIAEDLVEPLRTFSPGPDFVRQLRWAHEHRAHLQAGLRRRSDFARILPHPRASAVMPDVDHILGEGGLAELHRAITELERHPSEVGEHELRLLERRFIDAPELRPRVADLLYRAAPERFTELLEAMIARPEAELPGRERDGLLHLYGCNPWNRDASRQLLRWLRIGTMTNRSEVVQSKYGLHHLAEAGEQEFERVLARLLADEAPIVIGTLRWLHDNPQVLARLPEAELGALILPLLGHEQRDVQFEALQLLRVANFGLPLDRLEHHLAPDVHPRLRSGAVELLELLPIAEVRERLVALLGEDEPVICWAATRSLLRGQGSAGERIESAQRITERLLGLVASEQAGTHLARRILQALTSADSFDSVEPILRSCATLSTGGSPSGLSESESLAVFKLLAAALTPTLLAFDDPRLLGWLRREAKAFGLDPPHGLARFIQHHGSPAIEQDLALVHAAQGAVDPWAGYEAMAVLASWGDAEARAELVRALDYASPFAEAALEAWYGAFGANEFERLERARCGDPRRQASAWRVLIDRARQGSPSSRRSMREYMQGSPRRARAWAEFIEQQLRGEVPGKFVVGGQDASWVVFAELLPDRFEARIEQILSGTPDRFSLDLLVWLADERPAVAREWAERLIDSPHWGIRQCARRIIESQPLASLAVGSDAGPAML